MKILFALALLSLFTAAPASASITDQEMLLAPPTRPKLESSIEQEQVYQLPSPQRISVGLGSGVNSPRGNLGKLYGASRPVVDLRFDWAFHPTWSLRVGGELADYRFTAEPNGNVGVKTRSLQIASQSHFLSSALVNEGFDPYLTLNAGWIFRDQNFEAHNSIERDQAYSFGAGLGANYLMAGGHMAFWFEGGASQPFFKDRFEQEYLESGLEDINGALLTARIGMKYLF